MMAGADRKTGAFFQRFRTGLVLESGNCNPHGSSAPNKGFLQRMVRQDFVGLFPACAVAPALQRSPGLSGAELIPKIDRR
jgi:hypothetical protein